MCKKVLCEALEIINRCSFHWISLRFASLKQHRFSNKKKVSGGSTWGGGGRWRIFENIEKRKSTFSSIICSFLVVLKKSFSFWDFSFVRSGNLREIYSLHGVVEWEWWKFNWHSHPICLLSTKFIFYTLINMKMILEKSLRFDFGMLNNPRKKRKAQFTIQ